MPLLNRVIDHLGSKKKRYFFLVLLGSVPQAIAGFIFYRHAILLSDSSNYFNIARNLAAGRGFTDNFPLMNPLVLHQSAWRPPLYPLLLSVVLFAFGPHIIVAQIFNASTGVLDIILVDITVRKILFSRFKEDQDLKLSSTAGIMASLLLATYPPFLSDTLVPLTEPLEILLILCTALWLANSRYLLASLAAGLLMLTKPGAEAFALITSLLTFKFLGYRIGFKSLAVVILVILPWLTRNYVVLGAPVLETSDGFNLASEYSQYSEQSKGFVDPVFDPRFKSYWPLEDNEVKWDQTLASLGLDNIKSHPVVVFDVFKRNVETMFQFRPIMSNPAENSDLRDLAFVNNSRQWIYFISAIGLYFSLYFIKDRLMVILLALVGLDTLSGLFSTGAPRLRSSFDVLSCIGFGLGYYLYRQSIHKHAESKVASKHFLSFY